MSTPHTACGVATREQRLKRKMGGWRMRSTEESKRQAENVRERGMKSAYERQEDIISDFKK